MNHEAVDTRRRVTKAPRPVGNDLRDHSVRPEQQSTADVYYNAAESSKYHTHRHTVEVQRQMTEQAMSLLNLPEGPKMGLDIGCGSGLSGMSLSEAGHWWLGMDLSSDMLHLANQNPIRDFDLFRADIGQNLSFRPGSFDFAISVSVIQWLCYAHSKHENPYKRLLTFFSWLRNALSASGKAVLQFYPEHQQQTEMIITTCKKAGFTCGIVEQRKSEESSKYKLYLVCAVGTLIDPTKNKEEVEQMMTHSRKKMFKHGKKDKAPKKTRAYILAKKEKQRLKLGDDKVRTDTKYTGRNRRRH